MRSTKQGALAVLAAAVAALALPAADSGGPYDGTWKVTVLQGNGKEVTPWLVKVETAKGDKVTAKVVSSHSDFKDSSVAALKTAPESVHMRLKAGDNTFTLVAYPPKGKEKPTQLLGTVALGPTRLFPLRLEKTTLKKIDDEDAEKLMEGADALQKAFEEEELDDRIKAIQGVVKKYSGKPIALVAS